MYLKLSPEHEQQIVDMDKDGKQPGEIIDFFLQNYKIELTEKKIKRVIAKAAKAKATKKLLRKVRKYQRRARAHAQQGQEISLEQMIQDIPKLVEEINQCYRLVVKKLRRDLIASRAQVHEMLKGAGVEIPHSSIKEDED